MRISARDRTRDQLVGGTDVAQHVRVHPADGLERACLAALRLISRANGRQRARRLQPFTERRECAARPRRDGRTMDGEDEYVMAVSFAIGDAGKLRSPAIG